MAQLWGGRFEGNVNEDVWRFNASLKFDIRLLPYDIEGSIAHAKMLGKQGIITADEADAIVKGLEEILREFCPSDRGSGTLSDSSGASTCQTAKSDSVPDPLSDVLPDDEDVHSLVERLLIEKIGETGKKLHTGRSRNDQVATDMRLYTRHDIKEKQKLLGEMCETLYNLMEVHLHTVMPGFTHLQKAQPVTLAHHLGAYFEMFGRDTDRLSDILYRMDECPLGSGALAGTTYPIDREYTAELLHFEEPCANSMDGVSDRDYLVEYLAALSLVQMHLSRFAEEMILWNSDEYRFITMDDAFATGSSIMPQKKNPDVAELVRGKTGRVYGDLMSLLTLLKGLPLAYNKDMQEDKEAAFDAFDTVGDTLSLFTRMLQTVTFHKDRMEASAKGSFANATDLADYLAKKGMPFRDAHEVTGRIVLHCIEEKCAIEDLPLEELKTFSELFEEDVYEEIALLTCVEKRTSYGGPAPEVMKAWLEMMD